MQGRDPDLASADSLRIYCPKMKRRTQRHTQQSRWQHSALHNTQHSENYTSGSDGKKNLTKRCQNVSSHKSWFDVCVINRRDLTLYIINPVKYAVILLPQLLFLKMEQWKILSCILINTLKAKITIYSNLNAVIMMHVYSWNGQLFHFPSRSLCFSVGTISSMATANSLATVFMCVFL